MATIDLYTKVGCPYCARAKALLTAKGAAFNDHDVTDGGAAKAEMLERNPAARTVPQIFIDGKLIGGSDDLIKLDASGGLDALLA